MKKKTFALAYVAVVGSIILFTWIIKDFQVHETSEENKSFELNLYNKKYNLTKIYRPEVIGNVDYIIGFDGKGRKENNVVFVIGDDFEFERPDDFQTGVDEYREPDKSGVKSSEFIPELLRIISHALHTNSEVEKVGQEIPCELVFVLGNEGYILSLTINPENRIIYGPSLVYEGLFEEMARIELFPDEG